MLAKKPGRPGRPPEAGERLQIGVQVSPRVKKLLETAAEHNHRSLSREAEYRLEQSFERDRVSRALATLAYFFVPHLMTQVAEHDDGLGVLEEFVREFELLQTGQFAAMSADGPLAELRKQALKAKAQRLKHPKGESGRSEGSADGSTPSPRKKTPSRK